MPVIITKELEAPKTQVLVGTYTSGTAPEPGDDTVAIYMDLTDLDQKKHVTVLSRIEELINRAREEDYRRPSVTTCFWRLPLRAPKANIEFITSNLEIVEGDLAIGMDGAGVRGALKGSVIVDGAFKELTHYLGRTA